jgi:Ca2+-binding EF-hand superfamily protein
VTLHEYLNQPPADYPEARFDDMDHNGDGILTRYEWHADRESFERMDRNDDGVVTSREFIDPGSLGRRRDVRFRELDRNQDGRISRTEWVGDAEAFRLLDQDVNGVVNLSEYESTWALSRRFRLLDHDGTGDLSREEWPGDRVRFARLDRDRNGLVTRDEYLY